MPTPPTFQSRNNSNKATAAAAVAQAVVAIDDEWRTLDSAIETAPVTAKTPPPPPQPPPRPRLAVPRSPALPAPRALGAALTPKSKPSVATAPQPPRPARAPLPPLAPRPRLTPPPPPVLARDRPVAPPPVEVIVQPVVEEMICASVIVEAQAPVELVPVVVKPLVVKPVAVEAVAVEAAIIVVEAAPVVVEEPLAIVPRPSLQIDRSAVIEVFAAGGAADLFDDVPIAALQSKTTLYAMWSALGVAVATGMGSAIWMAFIQKPF